MSDFSIEQSSIDEYLLKDDGTFPNNESLPVVVYKSVLHKSNNKDEANMVEKLFNQNGWLNAWRNGIFSVHHYHSTAHEVLGVYRGNAKVQLGGPGGIVVELNAGDVVVIPAGVAHKNIESSKNFKCVGAYPGDQQYDMNYGVPGERPGTDKNIKQVKFPKSDPVFGKNGPLLKLWKS